MNSLRSIWVCPFAAIAGFFFFAALAQAWERAVYGWLRSSLIAAIDHARLTPHRLIAEIEGDKALKDLAGRLKTDAELMT